MPESQSEFEAHDFVHALCGPHIKPSLQPSEQGHWRPPGQRSGGGGSVVAGRVVTGGGPSVKPDSVEEGGVERGHPSMRIERRIVIRGFTIVKIPLSPSR